MDKNKIIRYFNQESKYKTYKLFLINLKNCQIRFNKIVKTSSSKDNIINEIIKILELDINNNYEWFYFFHLYLLENIKGNITKNSNLLKTLNEYEFIVNEYILKGDSNFKRHISRYNYCVYKKYIANQKKIRALEKKIEEKKNISLPGFFATNNIK